MIVAYEAVTRRARRPVGDPHLRRRGMAPQRALGRRPRLLDAVRDGFASGRDGGPDTTGALLYALLDAAVDSYFPELDTISERIDALEDRVLEGDADRDSLAEILAPQASPPGAATRPGADARRGERAPAPRPRDRRRMHRRRTTRTSTTTSSASSTSSTSTATSWPAVLDARLTVASNSLNAIMKRLTAFTVVLMVPTLIAGIYGMNFDLMPELRWPFGYPLALASWRPPWSSRSRTSAARAGSRRGTRPASVGRHDHPAATRRRDPPPTPIDTPNETPNDPPDADPVPEQRAPGQDQPPMGAPRDEPDPDMA